MKFIFSLIFIISLFGNAQPLPAQQNTTPSANKQAIAQPAPEVSFTQKTRAVVQIKKKEGVLNAEIEQNERDLHLHLTVARGTPVRHAKAIMGHYIKMVTDSVSILEPNGPIFDYTVTLRHPSGEMIAAGLKPKDSRTVIWGDGEETEVNQGQPAQKQRARQRSPLEQKRQQFPNVDTLDLLDFPASILKAMQGEKPEQDSTR